jgi:putative endonuclease
VNTWKTGQIGEDVACVFLVKQGYSLVERNYWKKWGEIDIVAKKDNILHFIEVKSTAIAVSSIFPQSGWRPEDRVHQSKQLRQRRVILTYLAERGVDPDCDFVISVAVVYIDMGKRVGRVYLIENIII